MKVNKDKMLIKAAVKAGPVRTRQFINEVAKLKASRGNDIIIHFAYNQKVYHMNVNNIIRNLQSWI